MSGRHDVGLLVAERELDDAFEQASQKGATPGPTSAMITDPAIRLRMSTKISV